MAKKKSKELNLTKLRDINKKYNQTYTIDVDGYRVDAYKFWRQDWIDDLITEATKNYIDHSNEEDFTEQFFIRYLYFLAIKWFTDLKVPEPFDKQLKWMNELVKSGYYKIIVENLPQDELIRVFNQISETTDKLAEAQKDQEMLSEMNDEIVDVSNIPDEVEDIEIEDDDESTDSE